MAWKPGMTVAEEIEDLWRIRRKALEQAAKMRAELVAWAVERPRPKTHAEDCRLMREVIAEAEEVAAGCLSDIEARENKKN
jgi:hypothetical protein